MSKLTKSQLAFLRRAAAMGDAGVHLDGPKWLTARALEKKGLVSRPRFSIGQAFITQAGRKAIKECP